MEPARGGLPQQRRFGQPLVLGTRHQAEDILQLAEISFRRDDRTAENAAGTAAGTEVCGAASTGGTERSRGDRTHRFRFAGGV